MISRRAPLLLALPVVLGPLHPTAPALADPARAAAPDAGTLEATLDELEARVRQLSEAEAAATVTALRQELAVARGRIAELEAARAADATTVADLRAELANTRAEARTLSEQLEVSRRGLERLNAVLAAAAAGSSAAEGEGRADDARGTAAEAASPAPGAATAGSPAAGDEGEETPPADEAGYYAATQPVRLRAEPRTTAEVLTVVGAGAVVRRLGRNGGWLRVAYTDRLAQPYTGWVHSNFLRSASGRQGS
jgi:hypothetical protein